jgi:divalent metal cation (Fe/Co/Zn/Cd) transporter
VYKQLLSHHNNTHTECIAAVAVVVFVIIVGFSLLVTVLLIIITPRIRPHRADWLVWLSYIALFILLIPLGLAVEWKV